MSKLKTIFTFLKKYRLFSLSLIAAIIALVLDLIGSKHSGLRTAAHILLATESLTVALICVWRMIDKLRWGSWGIDVLAVTAIVTSVILKDYWTAIIIVLMLTGGESLEHFAESRAKSELSELLKLAPQTATILRGRKTSF